MTDNVIDARERFLSKAILNSMEEFIDNDPKYHPYYLLLEEDGKDYIELRLRCEKLQSDIVLDKAPIYVIKERLENGICVVNLNPRITH